MMNAYFRTFCERAFVWGAIVGSLALAAGPARGEQPPPASAESALEFTLELKDSTRVRGKLLNLEPIGLQTDFGQAALPLRLVGTIDLAGQEQRCVVQFLNGDRLTGRLTVENVSIRTSYGELAIPIEQIVRMVSSAAPAEKKTAATPGGDAFTLITAENWEKSVLRGKGTTLVLFTSPSCKVCQEAIPLVARIYGASSDQVKLAVVNVDRSADLAKSLGVSQVPFAIVYENGSESEREVIQLAKLKEVARGRDDPDTTLKR